MQQEAQYLLCYVQIGKQFYQHSGNASESPGSENQLLKFNLILDYSVKEMQATDEKM